MIYQEPMASLNPAMKVGQQLMEVPILHEKVSKEEAYKRALEMVRSVRLPDPERMMRSYPHQLSGGQQQRIVIAMALLSKPALLLLDEPTTALDVTVEAGIVELVKGLGEKFGTSMIFVSHNLGLILETCDRITVMYSGEAVETGKIADVFDRMRHPYTQGLFRSIPLPGADKNSRPLIAIPGQLPLPHERPKGCNFGPRCQHFVKGRCDADEIPMIPVDGHDGHFSRCVRFNEIDWNALPEGAKKQNEPIVPGAPVLKIEDLKKYYKVAANEIFGGAARAAWSRPTRRSASRRANPRRWRSSANPAAASRRSPRCCSASRRRARARSRSTTRKSSRPASKSATSRPCRRSRWCSRTRSTRSIRAIRSARRSSARWKSSASARRSADRRARMLELLDLVKLPRAFETRMPRQLSGGQKQRIGVARAFAGNARVVVADEPVSALDVSVQAAVTELLMDIQRKSKTTMLFISHDLSRGALHRRPRRRHVSRPYRRAGHDRPDLLAALPSLYRGAAVGDPDRRHQRGQEAHRARRRHSVGDEPAARLPVPDALQLQEAGARQSVRDGGAAGEATSAAATRCMCHLPDDEFARRWSR